MVEVAWNMEHGTRNMELIWNSSFYIVPTRKHQNWKRVRVKTGNWARRIGDWGSLGGWRSGNIAADGILH